MDRAPPSRIRTLDLIRGIAVLGILAINITGFAAPTGALHSPNLPRPGTGLDAFAFTASLVLFDGKMRALFSILFGASLVLFVERMEQAGRNGTLLQIRRLGWLLVLGYAHFALLWDGDILFLYAAVGFAALGLYRLKPASLAVMALLFSLLWQVWGAALWVPSLVPEAAVLSGTAPPDLARSYSAMIADYRTSDQALTREVLQDWRGEVTTQLADRAGFPIELVYYNWGETLPWMLLGMALIKSGFFAGQWRRRTLVRLAAWGLGLGGLASLGFALWARAHGWPEMAMRYAASFGMTLPHAGMALGYAALIALAAPRLLGTGIGLRLEAAGRMAFSNYIGTSLVMSGLFHGWGLGLFGQFGTASRWLFVLLGWALMLGWSKGWLQRFRQGPLEWLWRSLTEWRILPILAR